MDHLPDELLLNILNYLNKEELITTAGSCGQLNRIAKDWTLWRNSGLVFRKKRNYNLEKVLKAFPVEYIEFSNDPCDLELRIVARNCPRLKTLALFGIRRLSHDGLSAIAEGCPNLIHLEIYAYNNEDYIYHGNLYDEYVHLLYLTLGSFLDGLYTLLETTQIADLTLWEFIIPGTHLEHISQRCPELRRLSLTQCSGFTVRTINKLAEYCPKLERFYVDSAAMVPASEDLANFLTQHPNDSLEVYVPDNIRYIV